MRRHRRLAASAGAITLMLLASALSAVPAAAKTEQKRPDLPGEASVGSQHFLVHYTLSGDNAVDPTDANGNGTPDYAERVLEALEFSWQTEIDQMGWAAPPEDRGEGGDNRLDVYLESLLSQDIAGYTESEGGYVGDNPNTPQRERRASYSYMSIDHGFAEADLGPGEKPEQVMQATVAHEFNHALQAGYDDFDPQTWLYEATATWMEARVYPDITDSNSYLADILDAPETCRAAEAGWYGSWLFIQMISDRYGAETVRSIWEHSRKSDGYQAIDEALKPFKTSLVAQSRDFAVANLLRAYQAGAGYPTVRQAGEIDAEGTFAPSEGVQSLGASIVRLKGNGSSAAQFAGHKALTARVVGIRGGQADVIDFVNGKASLDLSQYDAAYVVVHNDELAGDENACRARDYSVTLSAGDGSVSAVASTWPAPNYAGLSTGAGQASSEKNIHSTYQGGGAGAVESPEALKVDFTTIVPKPPDSYYFDYAYIMTPDDFGTDAQFYVPQADQSANFDYLNADGNWLSIAESPADYATLQDWEDDIQYAPAAEPETINGVEVLIEDTGDQKEQSFTATMIIQGLFVVIDGDHGRDNVKAMALAILDARKPARAADAQGGTQFPAPDAATPTPAFVPETPPIDDNTTSLVILGAMALCGLGVCLAGVGVVLAVMMVRRRKG